MDQKTATIIDYFKKINQIPRCSKNEAAISAWFKRWADEQGLESRRDALGNICIAVPALPSLESGPVVVLQGHMDMVCEKTPDKAHDFTKDPIDLVFDGDWLRADGTTLGADNGVALALALALATDSTITRPALELLFTVDEETGLTGAEQMAPGFVHGKILINIDSEDEGVFTVGCAGGNQVEIDVPLHYSEINPHERLMQIEVSGLMGGHSGIDINKGRASANKILARLLNHLAKKMNLRLVDIQGGTTHNAIARDARCIMASATDQLAEMERRVEGFARSLTEEYHAVDPNLRVVLKRFSALSRPNGAADGAQSERIIGLLMALPHGVVSMNPQSPQHVETSCNLAEVKIQDNCLHILNSQRANVTSRLDEITARIECMAQLAGGSMKMIHKYPVWPPDLDSPLLQNCKAIYAKLFNKIPKIEIIHAGLECGVIGAKHPGMEMISLGPTLENPHSPDERLYIPSLIKVWDFMVALLAHYADPAAPTAF
jgi:dipeptidase D